MSKSPVLKKENPKRKLWETLPTVEERISFGKGLRDTVPRDSHGEWSPTKKREDPVKLLISSNRDRLPELLPIRYNRMSQSPFAFLRGSAIVMASDLSTTPASGINVQCCGDCHLMNFGTYGTPERNLVFDINDFDETLPAPWEWDLKRLAASIVVAARYKGFGTKETKEAVLSLVRTYRDKLNKYAGMRTLEVWYSRLNEDAVMEAFRSDKETIKLMKNSAAKARQRTNEVMFPKLVEVSGGKHLIKDEPPLIYHLRDTDALIKSTHKFFEDYMGAISDDKKSLLRRYQLMDVAMKVVGVGSVGTRCLIGLFMNGAKDALVLQFKEGRNSVLEPYTKNSVYKNHGERIVNGQKMMQAVSDIFLGWTRGPEGRDFYVRQLRDMKNSADLEAFSSSIFINYATLCGWALAKSHAKSGMAPEISGYIGKSDEIPQSFTKFAFAYADQNDKDYDLLKTEIKNGLIEVSAEV